MKNKLLYALCFVGTVMAAVSCKKGENPEPLPPFIDRLAKTYSGQFGHYICGFPTTMQYSIDDSEAAIRKLTETEINVVISTAPIGTLMEFEAVVDSDSTFAIPEFLSNEGVAYTGIGKYKDKLSILIGETCRDDFIQPLATYVFAEK